MDQQILIYTMTAFVVVSAIALVIQMGTMIAIYKATKEFQTKGAQTLRKGGNLRGNSYDDGRAGEEADSGNKHPSERNP